MPLKSLDGHYHVKLNLVVQPLTGTSSPTSVFPWSCHMCTDRGRLRSKTQFMTQSAWPVWKRSRSHYSQHEYLTASLLSP
ncbi:hypothetical protein FOXYSP1_05210 [Fusarium oxysporum f. sp. phaseoli]